MKVLLLQPPSGSPFSDKVFLHEPLALEYLGAGIRLDGNEVRLHDARLDPDMDGTVTSFAPDIVGLTGYTIQLPVICSLAERIKSVRPEAFVVVGGHHATVAPHDFNRESIDLVVMGEGVTTLREILTAIQEGSGFDKIPGLVIR